ncbi:hypothetical protein DITRI_Ditri01bG0029300 [Diplodiscus trichospermus]
MILTIALAHIFVEIQNSVLNKIFTEITTKFWSEWELRLMLIVSLTLQFVLVISGNLRRGYIGKKLPYVAMMVWIVYLSADWVATIALSTLLRGGVHLKNGLVVFWTPFLLWHLGSPHNITAYSLEDNDMWLRHFLGMVFLVLEAIYIYIRFRSDTALNFLAVPIFLAGVVKYGERIWALRAASEKQLIKSVCSSEENASPQEKFIRRGLPESTIIRCFEGRGNDTEQLKLLRQAYSSFTIFQPLFLGHRFWLSSKFYDDMVYIKSKTADQAFQLVGTELGYLYDLLFTKMPIHQPKESYYHRVFCFLSAVSSLIAFSAIEVKSAQTVDIVITYLLLLGAICLDVYSFIMHAFSTWTMIWLSISENKAQKWYSMAVASRMHYIKGKMAIRSMAQHDLIYYYVKAKTNTLMDAVRVIDTGSLLQKYGNSDWKTVDSELKQFIYSYLKEKRKQWAEKNFLPEELEKLFSGKGENILAEAEIDIEELELDKADFIQHIFFWHFATELLYYDDVDRFRRGNLGLHCPIAKTLSDYMMYLVLVRPLMLPKGLGEVINEKNYDAAKRFFPDMEKKVTTKDSIQFRKTFTAAVLGHKSFRSQKNRFEVIEEGSTFAQKLQNFVTEHQWDHEEKWEMISKVWMEMMTHAASHCSWKEHAQQLRHGGELLTHVSLLMAHLGLTTQIHREEADVEDEFDMLHFNTRFQWS